MVWEISFLVLSFQPSREKEELEDNIVNDCLYGIDAAKEPPLARIARINMFLHGDGGSRIYYADGLDKNINTDKAESKEHARDLNELKNKLIKEKTVFDVVLTNPPFAVKFLSNKQEDMKTLIQYSIAKKLNTNEFFPTTRSNTLFLERYEGMLSPGGKLITVIDDTPLNGAGEVAQNFRRYLRNNFIIRAIISLPKNAFVNAGTGPKTSILYATKKKSLDESQPSIFMAISESIGHDNTGRPSNDSDLPEILSLFQTYEKTGKKVHREKSPQVFVVEPGQLQDELNAYIYCNELIAIKKKIKELEKERKVKVIPGDQAPLVGNVIERNRQQLTFKYIALRDVTSDGNIYHYKIHSRESLPTRAKKMLRTNDVIMSRNAGSLGKIAIIPDWLNGNFCSDGFLVFRMGTEEDARILYAILKSDIVQKQMFYAQRESTQPDIKETTFKERVLIPYPLDKTLIRSLKEKVKDIQTMRTKTREQETKIWEELNKYTGWKPYSTLEFDETDDSD